mmetsp:Transcript_11581/g.42885  ORF Transcript_11581/g.42885 Transcript_11581/m.42885 type:complete len:244 (-) Transcript_11581:3054-3785(-)
MEDPAGQDGGYEHGAEVLETLVAVARVRAAPHAAHVPLGGAVFRVQHVSAAPARARPVVAAPNLFRDRGFLLLLGPQGAAPQERVQIRAQGTPRTHAPVRNRGGVRAPGGDVRVGNRNPVGPASFRETHDHAVGVAVRAPLGNNRGPQRVRPALQPHELDSLLGRRGAPRLPSQDVQGAVQLDLHVVRLFLRHGQGIQNAANETAKWYRKQGVPGAVQGRAERSGGGGGGSPQSQNGVMNVAR